MRSRLLDESDRGLVDRLLSVDPVLNVFVAARVESGLLRQRSLGELWGYPAESPRSLVHVGANLMPIGTDAEARREFAGRLGPRRTSSAIVGRADEVAGMWRELSDRWGRPYRDYRMVRRSQPVLAATELCPIEPDPRVVRITGEHGESYFDAAVAMYAEELGENPLITNPYGYRRYVMGLISSGRTFGMVLDGEVVFKADLGAVGRGVVQIQGVWLAPRLRGQGWAAPAMAAVTNHIVRSGRIASLYVNDFNAPALATYRRCGYTERGVFTTVLY